MQRYIWNECGCLDGRTIAPVLSQSLKCGHTDNADAIAFPEKHNVSHCLIIQNLLAKSECRDTFGKLLRDLECLKRVKQQFVHLKEKLCQCPEACDSFDFEIFYSLANWPSDGPELEAAYQQLIVDKMVKDFNESTQQKQDSVTVPDTWWTLINGTFPDYYYDIFKDPWLKKTILAYLLNPANRREILKDFTRLTIYVKDLTVETTEDVPGYPWESLLSDIGKYYYCLGP